MVQFYQRNIAAWMDGTESLEDGVYRVYDIVCNLIYLNNGAIVVNETGIAGRCNQHILKFRRNFSKLVELKKLIIDPVSGKVTNLRVEQELKRIGAGKKPKPSVNPDPTSSLPPPSADQVDWGLPGGVRPKPLKTNASDLGGGSLDKRRQDNKEAPLVPPRGGRVKSTNRKTAFPADLTLETDGLREYAAAHGFVGDAADRLFEIFRGHHLAKGTKFVRWDMGWQTWVRNELSFHPRGRGGVNGQAVGRSGGARGFADIAGRIRTGAVAHAESADVYSGEPAADARRSH